MSNQDEVAQMLDDLERRSEKLTYWETTFVDSVTEQMVRRPLSVKQIETVEKIWERVT